MSNTQAVKAVKSLRLAISAALIGSPPRPRRQPAPLVGSALRLA